MINEAVAVFEEVTGQDPVVYEISYLFIPSLAPEALLKETEGLTGTITRLGGSVLQTGDARSIRLAYPMVKSVLNKRSVFDSAFFGWVKFELVPEKVLELKRTLADDEIIIRFLIIRTIKEAPFVPKLQTVKRIPRTVDGKLGKLETREAPEKVDEAELDKELEGLLAG